MEPWIAEGVEAREEGQANGADECEENGHAAEDLLGKRCVGDQAALMAQQPVGDEGCVEKDSCEDASHYEQRLQLGGANVGDVCDGLAILLRRVSSLARVYAPVQKEAQ